MARRILGPDRDVLLLIAAPIKAGNGSAARSCVNNVRVSRIGSKVAALPAARVEPVLTPDVAVVGAAEDADCRIVLLRAVHLVQKIVVRRHVIELRRRLVVLRRPTLAAIR